MNYTRLPTIEAFGAQLLATGDLDPLYIALVNANLDRDQLRRWLLAYWCCYHAGASSWLSEQDEYWDCLFVMAENIHPTPLGGRWPRGHERRHFRGEKAMRAVDSYRDRFNTPEALVEWVEQSGPRFSLVRDRVMTLPQMGTWIAWKIADMLERVLRIPVDFRGASLDIYREPAAAAELVDPTKSLSQVVDRLVGHFSGSLAPPSFDRVVGIAEIETVLCKWKSHLNGHYPLNNDIHEIRGGLVGWGETADKLLVVMPEAKE